MLRATTKFSGSVRGFSSIQRALDLNGIFIPLTTPFLPNGDIAFDQLKSNLRHYEKIPFKGYVVAGSNGEAPYLTPSERVGLVEFVRQSTHPAKMLIGGSTSESTKAAVELTNEMKRVGADGALVMPPFYFRARMSEDAIIEHYTTIHDSCEFPIIIYNMPMVTGIDISTQTITKLAHLPLIRGVKDSDIRKSAGTVISTKGLNFDVLIGSAGYLLGSLMNGCSGAINGLAGILGNELCLIYELFKSGKYDEAAQLQKRISPSDTLLMSQLGVPGLKAAMNMCGLIGGHCRKPILPSTDLDQQRIRETLQKGGFLQ